MEPNSPDEKAQSEVSVQITEQIGEDFPPYLIWILGYFVSALVSGAFFLTGLFFSHLMELKGTFADGILTGFIPGLVSGGVMVGLVYSVHPRWTGKAIGLALFGISIPLILLPMVFGLTTAFAVVMAPLATVLAGLIAPKIVKTDRVKNMGRVKAPKGSWEDNF